MSIQYRIEVFQYNKPIPNSASKYDPILEQLRPGQRVIVPIDDTPKISQALRKHLAKRGFEHTGAVKIETEPCDLNGTRLVGEGAIYLLHEKPISKQGADKPMPQPTPTPVDKPRTVMAPRSPWPTVAPKAKPAATKKKA